MLAARPRWLHRIAIMRLADGNQAFDQPAAHGLLFSGNHREGLARGFVVARDSAQDPQIELLAERAVVRVAGPLLQELRERQRCVPRGGGGVWTGSFERSGGLGRGDRRLFARGDCGQHGRRNRLRRFGRDGRCGRCSGFGLRRRRVYMFGRGLDHVDHFDGRRAMRRRGVRQFVRVSVLWRETVPGPDGHAAKSYQPVRCTRGPLGANSGLVGSNRLRLRLRLTTAVSGFAPGYFRPVQRRPEFDQAACKGK